MVGGWLERRVEEAEQFVVGVVVEDGFEGAQFGLDVVHALDLGYVVVEVRDDGPQIRQFSRLALKRPLNTVRILEYGLVLIAHEIRVGLLHRDLLEPVYQLYLLGQGVLFVEPLVQQFQVGVD